MDAENWQRLKAAFARYYESSPGEQEAFLTQLRRDDPQLARELWQLVQSDRSARRKQWWPVGREAGRAEDFQGNSRFTLQERLGVGGFGAVYRAYDAHADRIVALKVLRVHEPRSLQAFKREFRVVANLRHPNLVRVYELFVEREHAYFAMELIDGAPITESVRARLGGATAAQYVEHVREAFDQLCRGLMALHRVGIVHRDLKPSNVLRTESGRVVILDFGQVTIGPKTLRPMGGTPAYRAPEVADGLDGGALSDWYAAGLILFEMLTGALPEPTLDPTSPDWSRSSLGSNLDAAGRETLGQLGVLCEELRRRAPDARPPEARILALLSSPTNDQRGAPSSAHWADHDGSLRGFKLFGRDRHLMMLFQHAERAAQGSFVLSPVVGASGMGKTALVQEFLRQLAVTRPDSIVLQGRCHERESLGFRVFDGIIDELATLLQREPSALLRRIVPEHAAELAMLFPGLSEALSVALPTALPTLHDVSANEQRRVAFTALVRLLANLARQKFVVIFADDLQWADEDSRQLLRFLLQSSASLPLMLIVAYRNDDDASTLVREIMSPSGRSRFEEVLVEPLQPEESRALLEDALGREHPTASISLAPHDGAPFLLNLLVEEARWTQVEAPTQVTVQDVDGLLARRIGRLKPEPRRFMALLAVAVQPMRRDWIYRALAWPWATSSDIEDLLRIRGMLRTVGSDSLEPFHDRVRTAFQAGLSESETVELHATLAEALEEEGGPELLSYHCLRAGLRERAIRYSWMAARKCAGAFAFERAAAHYREMLHLGTTDAGCVQAELADVLVNAGKGLEAARFYLCAADLVPERALDLRMRAGQQLVQSGQIEAGRRLLREILVAAGIFVPEGPLAMSAALLVKRLTLRNRLRGVITPVRESDPDALRVLEALWSLASTLALVDTIGAAYYEALFFGYALERGDSRSLARALSLEAIYSSIEGGAAESRVGKLIASVERACETSGELDTRALLDMAKSIVAWMAADFTYCLQCATSAEGLLTRHGRGLAFEFGTVRAFALASCIWLGKFAEHAERFHALRADAQQRNDVQTETNLVLLAHAHVHWLVRDEADRAEAEVDSMMQRWPFRRGLTLQQLWGLFSKVEIALYRGNGAAASELLESQWPQIRRSGHMRIAPIRIWFRQLRIRVLVAALGSGPAFSPSKREIEPIRRELRRLGREELPLGRALAALSRGLLRTLEGSRAAAWLEFDDAVGRFEALGMRLFASACRWARHCVAPDAAASERRDIEAAVLALGVVAPSRMLGLLVPVPEPSTESAVTTSLSILPQ